MRRPDLRLNVYSDDQRTIVDRAVLPDLTLRLMRMFRESASKRGLDLVLSRKDWPRAIREPEENGIINPRKLGSFAHLARPEHAADAAVLLVHDLGAIGPETAELLRRRREDLYHVFVVTLESLPDRRTSSDVFRGINTLPLAEPPAEGGLLEPVAPPETLGPAFDVEAQGLLSYHEYGALRSGRPSREVADRLETVRLLKEMHGAA